MNQYRSCELVRLPGGNRTSSCQKDCAEDRDSDSHLEQRCEILCGEVDPSPCDTTAYVSTDYRSILRPLLPRNLLPRSQHWLTRACVHARIMETVQGVWNACHALLPSRKLGLDGTTARISQKFLSNPKMLRLRLLHQIPRLPYLKPIVVRCNHYV